MDIRSVLITHVGRSISFDANGAYCRASGNAARYSCFVWTTRTHSLRCVFGESTRLRVNTVFGRINSTHDCGEAPAKQSESWKQCQREKCTPKVVGTWENRHLSRSYLSRPTAASRGAFDTSHPRAASVQYTYNMPVRARVCRCIQDGYYIMFGTECVVVGANCLLTFSQITSSYDMARRWRRTAYTYTA